MQPHRWVTAGLALVVALTLPACAPAPLQFSPDPKPPAFDLSAVKANFRDECKEPIIVDALFCKQIKMARMIADGDTLRAPTTLNAAANDRARAICDQIAVAHFDGDGNDLGYNFVRIFDEDGDQAAACEVDP
jgi:hypothetical protein